MTNASSTPILGRVASLHLHPPESAEPLHTVDRVEVIENKGILGEPRYFGRLGPTDGQPSRRQVSLIEREQLAEHAAALGLEKISPGAARSNIETDGVNWQGLLGQRVQIGDAVLLVDQPRKPCHKMDALCQGLRALMENNRQGVLAVVVRSGVISVGDTIRLVNAPELA
ncbi:MAG: MOSC domain-containing protein [Verrucomicrobia bacterium]|nr:MOSC domain-containing protein [Verrucomicrobiota bacterium]